MTEITPQDLAPSRGSHDWASGDAKRLVRKRYSADRRLKLLGLGAITLAIAMLATLLGSILLKAIPAFTQTHVAIPIMLDANQIDKDNPRKASYRRIANDAIANLFPEVKNRRQLRKIRAIPSSDLRFMLRDYVIANPDKIGQEIIFKVPASDPFDQLNKGVIPKYLPALSNTEISRFRSLQDMDMIVVEGGAAKLKADIVLDANDVDADDLDETDFAELIQDALVRVFPNAQGSTFRSIVDRSAVDVVKNVVKADPSKIGKTISVLLPLSSRYGELASGQEPRTVNPRFGSEAILKAWDSLVERGLVSAPLNFGLFTNSDSRFPELAGLSGAIWGSFYALMVCFLISFPVGIAAAIYLEEFAPKNKLTDLIEVNINNLAAVPSVVFGLLGLAVFLGFFGLPRSAPLVGGMVLSLMTLPTIIIATRAALKAVPPSIREAALGVGASKHQVMLHHVLPLAMPGILTGTIIGLAQALGETAPLLLIGMNAFITSDPGSVLEPATALPTQIFLWADSPERGFVARTSAAILVLLGFLLIMNALAIFLRHRFERKW